MLSFFFIEALRPSQSSARTCMSSARRKSAGRLYLISVSPRKGVLAIAKERFFWKRGAPYFGFSGGFLKAKKLGWK